MDFQERDAVFAVIGSLPEPLSVAQQKVTENGITYALLHDANTSVTKQLGLWSDHMQMPWMGYVIIDKSGRVAASDLQLAEAPGMADTNMNRILAALDKVQGPRTSLAGE